MNSSSNKVINKVNNKVINRVNNKNGIIFYTIMFLMAAFIILLLIFLINYLRIPCGSNGKMSYLMYLANMDPRISPCNPTEPVKEFEEREVKDEREVFHISDQIYTFPEAKEKCKAYGAELATRNQVTDAYNKGAEWISYGWSKGQKAFYPIQPCSYIKLRRQGINIGPPGVNGGKFKKTLRFGANCFGIKPPGSVIKPKSPICKEYGEEMICMKNPNACKVLDTDRLDPFIRDKLWSEYGD